MVRRGVPPPASAALPEDTLCGVPVRPQSVDRVSAAFTQKIHSRVDAFELEILQVRSLLHCSQPG